MKLKFYILIYWNLPMCISRCLTCGVLWYFSILNEDGSNILSDASWITSLTLIGPRVLGVNSLADLKCCIIVWK